MFLLKKIVSPLFYPLTLILGILLLGLFLLARTRRQKTGKIVILMGILSLGLLSFDPVSEALLRPLEYKYPPLLSLENLKDTKWIVVLGGGHVSDPRLPPNSQLSASALARLVEGIRFYRGLPNSKLILSGGALYDKVPEAKLFAEVAFEFGVKKEDMVLEEDSKDTEDEARLIAPIVGKERLVLVTSASHMPRSMTLFKRYGMSPLPAPTDHLTKEPGSISPRMFYPSAESLWNAERAFHEYLGLIWLRLKWLI